MLAGPTLAQVDAIHNLSVLYNFWQLFRPNLFKDTAAEKQIGCTEYLLPFCTTNYSTLTFQIISVLFRSLGTAFRIKNRSM
jgi:hypothetical protein